MGERPGEGGASPSHRTIRSTLEVQPPPGFLGGGGEYSSRRGRRRSASNLPIHRPHFRTLALSHSRTGRCTCPLASTRLSSTLVETDSHPQPHPLAPRC